TLRLRPFTDFRGVQSACRCPASGPSRPTRRGATAAPRGLDITRQRLAECLGVLGVQVDLILGTIQRKADGPLCLTTIDVIDEQGLYLLMHVHHGHVSLSRTLRLLSASERFSQSRE